MNTSHKLKYISTYRFKWVDCIHVLYTTHMTFMLSMTKMDNTRTKQRNVIEWRYTVLFDCYLIKCIILVHVTSSNNFKSCHPAHVMQHPSYVLLFVSLLFELWICQRRTYMRAWFFIVHMNIYEIEYTLYNILYKEKQLYVLITNVHMWNIMSILQ